MTEDFEILVARLETRLATQYAEHSAHLINATKALHEGLHEELINTNRGLEIMSEQVVSLRHTMDQRMALLERQVLILTDLVPGAAEMAGVIPLRETVAAVVAEQREQSATNEQQWAAIVILTACVVGIVAALFVGWWW